MKLFIAGELQGLNGKPLSADSLEQNIYAHEVAHIIMKERPGQQVTNKELCYRLLSLAKQPEQLLHAYDKALHEAAQMGKRPNYKKIAQQVLESLGLRKRRSQPGTGTAPKRRNLGASGVLAPAGGHVASGEAAGGGSEGGVAGGASVAAQGDTASEKEGVAEAGSDAAVQMGVDSNDQQHHEPAAGSEVLSAGAGAGEEEQLCDDQQTCVGGGSQGGVVGGASVATQGNLASEKAGVAEAASDAAALMGVDSNDQLHHDPAAGSVSSLSAGAGAGAGGEEKLCDDQQTSVGDGGWDGSSEMAMEACAHEVQHQRRKLHKMISTLQQQLSAARSAYSDQLMATEASEAVQRELRDQLMASTASLTATKISLEAAEGDLTTTKETLKTTQGQRDQLQHDLTTTKETLKTTQGQRDQLQHDLTTTKETLKTTQGQRDQLQHDLTTTKASLRTVEGQRDQLQHDLTTTKETLKTTQGQRDQLQHDLTTTKASLRTVEGQRDQLQHDLTTTEETLKTTQGQRDQLQHDLTTTKASLRTVEGQRDQLHHDLTTTKETLKTTQGQCDQLQAGLKAAQEEIDELDAKASFHAAKREDKAKGVCADAVGVLMPAMSTGEDGCSMERSSSNDLSASERNGDDVSSEEALTPAPEAWTASAITVRESDVPSLKEECSTVKPYVQQMVGHAVFRSNLVSSSGSVAAAVAIVKYALGSLVQDVGERIEEEKEKAEFVEDLGNLLTARRMPEFKMQCMVHMRRGVLTPEKRQAIIEGVRDQG